jgi:hypothetical protein
MQNSANRAREGGLDHVHHRSHSTKERQKNGVWPDHQRRFVLRLVLGTASGRGDRNPRRDASSPQRHGNNSVFFTRCRYTSMRSHGRLRSA